MPNDAEFTVRLSAEVKLWLKSESDRTGVPQAEIVRRILMEEKKYREAKSR